MKVLLQAMALAMLPFASAMACTLCHSNIAEQVRAAVRADFWPNFAISLIPFVIVLGISALIRGREARRE